VLGGDEGRTRMVDLHCHILPGLDDGPNRLEESLEMPESAIADGITQVAISSRAMRTTTRRGRRGYSLRTMP